MEEPECKIYCEQRFLVLNRATGEPIANADIEVNPIGAPKQIKGCTTGIDGFCGISDLCQGTRYVLCGKHPDYKIVSLGCQARLVFSGCSTTEYSRIYFRPETPKGKIIACNINKLPCLGDCGEAIEGQEIEVIMGMKNIGKTEEKFRFYIYDQDGREVSREPDFTYKNVKAGDTWGVSKTLFTNLNFKMLNKTLNGRVELKRQK